MLPPIPSSRIAPNDEGSPLWKPNNIADESLVPLPLKFYVEENMQHIISILKKQKDKGKKPISKFHNSKPPTKEKAGWSQAEIDQALEESIRIQPLKDKPNMMLMLSPLFHEGIIHELDMIPFMYYDLQIKIQIKLIYPSLHTTSFILSLLFSTQRMIRK